MKKHYQIVQIPPPLNHGRSRASAYIKSVCMLLVLVCFSTFSHKAMAQAKSVSGKILDENGVALPGVNIVVKGTSQGTTTDSDGKYVAEVLDGSSVLVFSFIGYKTQEITVENKTTIDVVLSPDVNALEEVVVVGYGTQRKSDVTGSLVSVKGADLTKIGGFSNAAEALQSKAAGVQVLSMGAPGSSPIVRIRGVGSNSNPSPIYVVDGMIVDDINFLNNHDIESMEVLKDASATAIYGARGANGVILVTTKKGKSGVTNVNFSASDGAQYLTRKFDTANASQYGQLVNNLQGTTVYPDPASLGKGTDWLKEVSQKGAAVRDYQLSLSGGTDKVRYNMSVGHYQQNGVYKFTDYKRTTIRLNTEFAVNKKIKIGENMSMSNSNNGTPDLYYLFMRSVNRISPILPVRDANGNFSVPQDSRLINPYAFLYYSKNYNSNDLKLVGNFWGTYEIIKGLTFRSSYGVNWLHNHTDQFTPAYNIIQPNQINPKNTYFNTFGVDYTWLWENTFTYDKQINNDHHINLLAGVTAQKRDRNFMTGTGTGYTLEDLDYVSLFSAPGSTRTLSAEQPLTETLLSYLFRANYALKDRYLLTASMRADGSSKFGINNRWGYFPSVAAGWRISEENFMSGANWLSNLKLRGSWGRTGNERIQSGVSYKLVTQDPVYDAVFNRTIYSNGAILNANNPNIKWEYSQQVDAGLELGVLDNRLTLDVDYFTRDTKNLLLTIPIPGGTAGINPTVSNAASMRNRGFEFNLGWQESKGDFHYGVRVIGTAFRNKVLDYAGQITTNNIFSTSLYTRIEAGQPLGYFYGYQAIGIYHNQAELDKWNTYAESKGNTVYHAGAQLGDLIFKDVDGNGKIDGKDMTNIGSPYPKFTGSLNLSASYKGFDFSVDLFGSFGGKILNNAYNQIEFNTTNLHKDWLNAWTPTNTTTNMPRLAVNSLNSQASSFIVQDGSYGKIRNIELGYTFNKAWMEKIKVRNIRIYVNGTNLLYITKYKGASPEVNSPDLLAQSVDLNPYPVASNVRLGLNASF